MYGSRVEAPRRDRSHQSIVCGGRPASLAGEEEEEEEEEDARRFGIS